MFEINFKEDGQVLTGADLMENLSFALTTSLNYALDGVTTTNQENLKIDLFGSNTASSLTNIQYDGGNDNYVISLQVDDEINDSNLTNNWTTDTQDGGGSASVTEDNNYISCKADATTGTAYAEAISDGTSPIDYYNSNQDVYIKTRIYLDDPINNAAFLCSARFGLTDGSNYVILKEVANNTSDDSIWEIYINASANTCDLYDDGVLDTADIDISSLSNNYYIYVYAESRNNGGSPPEAEARIYYLYSLGVGYSDAILETDTLSLTGSEDVAIAKFLSTMNDGCTISYGISFDNGGNYTSISPKELTKITNTGSNGKVKATITMPTIITPGTAPNRSTFDSYAYYCG